MYVPSEIGTQVVPRSFITRHPHRTQGHATQQARIHTLNRYGIVTYDFGTRYLQQGCVGMCGSTHQFMLFYGATCTRLPTITGDDVAQLQNYLREEGIMRSDDAYPGYFGEVTEAAVIKWQNRHDLPATGAFGDLARETYIQKQVCFLADIEGVHCVL